MNPLHVDLLEVVPGLADRLQAEGWAPGPPAHVAPASVLIDARLARDLDCAGCGHAGHAFAAFHQDGAYRGVATCYHCGAETEV